MNTINKETNNDCQETFTDWAFKQDSRITCIAHNCSLEDLWGTGDYHCHLCHADSLGVCQDHGTSLNPKYGCEDCLLEYARQLPLEALLFGML